MQARVINGRLQISLQKSEVRRETFRSGGPGGQYQNVTETGVRYVHISSGVKGESRSEASQRQNDKRAWSLLLANLAKMAENRRAEDASNRWKAKPNVSFGSQIRTYHFLEQKVIDHRTGCTQPIDQVVRRGRLDPFIDAFLRGDF